MEVYIIIGAFFIGVGAMLFFARNPRLIAIKKEFRITRNEVGPLLIAQFGRQDLYTLEQVDQVAKKAALTPKKTRFVHAVFCSKTDYNERYKPGAEAEVDSDFDFSPLDRDGTPSAQHGTSHSHDTNHDSGSYGGGHDGGGHDGGGGFDGGGDSGGDGGGGHGGD